MVRSLTPADPILYGNGSGTRLMLLFRHPDSAEMRQKMMFTSCQDALRRSLVGIDLDTSATDFSEAAYETSMYIGYYAYVQFHGSLTLR